MFKLDNFLKNQPQTRTAFQYFTFYIKRCLYQPKLSTKANQLLAQLRTHGFAVWEGYYTAEDCICLQNEIKQLFKNLPQYVNHRSDERFFGIEHLLPTVKEFAEAKLFSELASAVNRAPSRTAFTMANVLKADKRGSSGEGWHRDSFLSQFKTMVYLTDVEQENGPFEMLVGSHRLEQILQDMETADLNFMQNRLSDNEVDKLIAQHPERLKTFTASAGTLILFNSSTIHRGKPIIKGERIALTNYIYEEPMIGDWMINHFSPLYPHPVKN